MKAVPLALAKVDLEQGVYEKRKRETLYIPPVQCADPCMK